MLACQKQQVENCSVHTSPDLCGPTSCRWWSTGAGSPLDIGWGGCPLRHCFSTSKVTSWDGFDIWLGWTALRWGGDLGGDARKITSGLDCCPHDPSLWQNLDELEYSNCHGARGRQTQNKTQTWGEQTPSWAFLLWSNSANHYATVLPSWKGSSDD